MRWTQTQPESALLDAQAVQDHLRLSDFSAARQDAYLGTLIAAATAHAEQVMECSLLTRTITAIFYSGDILHLPRGPVQQINSVSIDGTPQMSASYTLEAQGNVDILRYANGRICPLAAPATLTVEYDAGYGDDPSDVPADIIHAIKAHIGLLFENREVAAQGAVTAVPFLDAFYRLHAREGGIG